MASRSSKTFVDNILFHMDWACEVKALKSLQALITAFAPLINDTDDSETRARLSTHIGRLSRCYLKSMFLGDDIPEFGPAAVGKAVEKLIAAAALEQETSYITSDRYRTPLDRLRLHRSARDVVQLRVDLGQYEDDLSRLSGDDALALEAILDDMKRWELMEAAHGTGAVLNLFHPWTINKMRLDQVVPFCGQEIENARRYQRSGPGAAPSTSLSRSSG